GAAYVYSLLPPKVQGTRVNDGAAQRSRVTSLTATFDSPVTFGTTPGAAFTLARAGGGSVGFTAAANVVNGQTVVTLNAFTGAGIPAIRLRPGAGGGTVGPPPAPPPPESPPCLRRACAAPPGPAWSGWRGAPPPPLSPSALSSAPTPSPPVTSTRARRRSTP